MTSRFRICILVALAILLVAFNAKSSRALVITACEQGDVADCEDIAWRAANIGLFRACHSGNNVAVCEELAARYATGRYEAPIPWKAIAEKACELNSARACNDLGVAWSTGKKGGLRVVPSLAVSYYKKACDLSHGPACLSFANMHRLSESVAGDMKLALEHYAKACDLDEATGCNELAIMYDEGKGVEKDPQMTSALFQKACKLGSATACKNAASLPPRPQQ